MFAFLQVNCNCNYTDIFVYANLALKHAMTINSMLNKIILPLKQSVTFIRYN